MEPLANREEFAHYLQGQVSDDVADLALADASGTIRGICGWHIAPVVTETFIIDGNGTSVLTLPTLRLVHVDRIRIDGQDYADFVAFPRGQIYRCGTWPARIGVVEVEVSHGFNEAPDAVRAVALGMAARSIWTAGRSAELRELTVGGIRQIFEPRSTQDVTPLQMAQLAAVRL